MNSKRIDIMNILVKKRSEHPSIVALQFSLNSFAEVICQLMIKYQQEHAQHKLKFESHALPFVGKQKSRIFDVLCNKSMSFEKKLVAISAIVDETFRRFPLNHSITQQNISCGLS